MLSIGRVAPGGRYYLDQIARGAEDYYLGAGEAPGQWIGHGATALRLAGEVDDAGFARLLDGQHPTTGQQLVAPGEKRVAGFDLTFSSPKSVSVLWALTDDPAVAAAVTRAHHAAICDALEYLQSDATWARRGDGGQQRVPTRGLIAAGFTHRTSRAADPQIHTHVVAANMVADHAGRFSAPDSRALYRHAKTAGYVYQAALRHELTVTLGVIWGPVRNGHADLADIPADLVSLFSKRRAEITDALDSRGLGSMDAGRVAALDTRRAKPRVAVPGAMPARWRAEATAAGHDPTVVVDRAVSFGRSAPALQAEEIRGLVDKLVSPAGLTAHKATFDRRDVVRAVAEAQRRGERLPVIETLAQLVTGHPAAVEITATDTLAPARAWTTVDLLAMEVAITETAAASTGAGIAVADSHSVEAAIASRSGLSGEQRAMVAGICRSGAGVEVVVGKPGSGKTYALDAARAAWEASGTMVIGAAVAARTAAGLEAGTGIPSSTLARLLADLEYPGIPGLPSGTVVCVDEAGMVGTSDLHRLARAATRNGLKIVLVGDTAQLPEIAAGGSFARLAQACGAWRLDANQRQTEAWERAALDDLRDRRPTAAVDAYRTHGRVTVAATAADTRAAMVADWHDSYVTGAPAVMYALRRLDVDDLNRRARQTLQADGQLTGPTVNVKSRDASGDEVGFAVGDRVICRRNDRRLEVTNGTQGVITDLDPTERTVTVDHHTVLPAGYLDAGHLAHGYAMTLHKAQGATVDRAFLLGDDRLYAEAGYVGLSRARHSTRLYVVANPQTTHSKSHDTSTEVSVVAHVTKALGQSRAQTTAGEQVDRAVNDRPLGELVPERHRLLRDLVASMPPDTTSRRRLLAETEASLADRHPELPWVAAARRNLERERRAIDHADTLRTTWVDAHRGDGDRLAALGAAIAHRQALLARAALADPAPDVLAVIGPAPVDRATRAAWVKAAGAIEAWTDLTGRPFGDRAPDDRDVAGWWHTARRAVDHPALAHHRHDHGLDHTNRREKGHEL